MLLFYNEKQRWNDTIEEVFIYSITCSSILVLLVIFMSLIFTILAKLVKKRSSKTHPKRSETYETGKNVLRRNPSPASEFGQSRNASKYENVSKIDSNLAMNSHL